MSRSRRAPPRKPDPSVLWLKQRMAAVVETLDLGEEEALDLKSTPRRVAEMLIELTAGYRESPPALHLSSADERQEMVVVTRISWTSICAHHLLPMSGEAAIGYLPDKHLIGLSKLVRVLDHFSKRLQLQERLGAQVASYIHEHAHTSSSFVLLNAEHACMGCRGVRRPSARTVTASIRPHDTSRDIINEFYRLVAVAADRR